MKIIHMSDIHGDLRTLDRGLDIVRDSGADVLAITGDLAGGYMGYGRDIIIQEVIDQYKEFKKRFDDLDQKTLVIPGNWDLPFFDDYLGNENIHNKGVVDIGGISFVGYGGINAYPRGLPEDLWIPFRESEALSYFEKHREANVILSHAYFDEFKNIKRSAILAGHVHDRINYYHPNNTLVSIANNFANYDSDSSTFSEISIHDNLIATIENTYSALE